MALSNRKKEQIALSVIKVLYSRFNSFPSVDGTNRNAPFHTAFMNAFKQKLNGRVKDVPDFISLSSWMHGLNTSLGQSFFESVAHILCDGEKREFKSKQIYANQMNAIGEIMTDLKNGDQVPSLSRENSILADKANGDKQTAPNFTADCFYETDTDVVAIEIKSVRPNSGEMRGEKQKVLIGRAVLSALYPNKNVSYLFGFPFDPTADTDTGYDKQRFLSSLVEGGKFVAEDDFMIADEFWSFLASSEGAMQEMLEIINRIATPRFMELFEKIQNKSGSREERRILLNDWYLYSEVEILENVRQPTSNSRIYNLSVFKPDGGYNARRIELLR